MKRTVCLIGKPNVGKSTIFNRLIGQKKSIIMDTPGITRDRIYGDVEYNEKQFLLIDTGGIEIANDEFNESIKMQASLAIEESDVIVFVVDGISEMTSDDYLVRDMLITSNKKVIVAVNKIDNQKVKDNIYSFYELGFEDVIGISAEHNIGFDNLLTKVTEDFPETEKIENKNLKFCIIGRPNVGKSSLINSLLDKERSIVSNIAGTTRDAIDTDFVYNKETYTVIDTAGMRKKGRIYENVEKYSLIRSLKAIDRSDVCVVVIDAESGIIEHDKHIISYVLDATKPLVLVVNKWDTIKDPNEETKKWKLLIQHEFQFIPYVKVVYLSALTKKRINELMPAIITAYENSHKTISTSALNNVIGDAYKLHMPPSYKGRRLKIYFTSQTGVNPPKITFSVNDKRLVHFSYERYLENKLRASFDFTGTPIVLQFKNKNKDDE